MPKSTNPKTDADIERSYLVREIESSARDIRPTGDLATFRQRLLQGVMSELANFTVAQLLRLREALSSIQFRGRDEDAVYLAVTRQLGIRQGLCRYKGVTLPALPAVRG